MERIITIDKNARLKIICGSIMLQYRKKSKTKQIAWHTDGHFSDYASMAEHYISNAPYRAIEGTASIEKLIEVVQQSSDQISRVLKNNQLNGKSHGKSNR
ncbi:MAG: hypothetical protein Q7T51_01935 [Candidatus Moranbacteria bacterium]|nr:hypothetical protein [Candidatus Moranbacteria bacterium]